MRIHVNKSLVLNRIKEAYDLAGNSELARFLGVAPNTITNWYNRNSLDYDLVFTKCENINIECLLTGKGSMLKEQNEYNTESSVLGEIDQKPLNENVDYKPRPYIDAYYGTLGMPNGFALAVKADQCEQISIPFVSNYDFSIKGRGDSMINRKNPDRSICDGDLIACRIWSSCSYIQWGQVYVLATSQGVVIKQIQESEKEGYIKCVSFNEEDGYKPYDMPVAEIYDWALVVAVTHTAKW